MNFVTKNIISDLKCLLELKILLQKAVMTDNNALLVDFLDKEIEKNIKDILYTEKL